MTSRVNIVVPVYNAEKYIKRCIESVLGQTHKNIRLILVNDGSADGSGEICEKYKNKDGRIVVIHQINHGSFKTRKAGLKVCPDDEYVMFVDADDYIPKNAVEKLYECAVKANADLVCGNITRIYKSIPLPLKKQCFKETDFKVYDREEIINKLYISCFGISYFPVSFCAKIYKGKVVKECLNYADTVRFWGDDLSFTIRLMPILDRLVIIPDVVYYYRFGGGTSKYNPYYLDDFIALYRLKKELAKQYPMPYDVDCIMSVEMKWVALDHLIFCKMRGRFTKEQIFDEIKRVCEIPEVVESVQNAGFIKKEPEGLRAAFEKKDYLYIQKTVDEKAKTRRLRSWVKAMLK